MAKSSDLQQKNLEKIFYPESLAVIGANKVQGTVPADIILNILKSDFQGIVYPVSPREHFISGIKCHKYVSDITDPVDLSQVETVPYPPSSRIVKIDWAPKEEIVRKAEGGDNWPVTWADDDLLYTAYGDGWGFQPFVEKKLSMGFASVSGSPKTFEGANIRTDSGEAVGQGEAGRKASGILMVDGVLYVLVRNANNSQLGWSSDYARTWEWAEWKFTESFGYPTFLNFGKN